jgi:hypothetical protein
MSPLKIATDQARYDEPFHLLPVAMAVLCKTAHLCALMCIKGPDNVGNPAFTA